MFKTGQEVRWSESCEVRARVPLRFYAERQENVQMHKQKILSTAGRRTLEPSPHFPSFLFISRMRMSPVIFMNTCSWNVSWIFNNQENRHSSLILGKLSYKWTCKTNINQNGYSNTPLRIIYSASYNYEKTHTEQYTSFEQVHSYNNCEMESGEWKVFWGILE